MVKARNAAHAEESAEVEVLLADASKFGDIGKRMKASLDRLQSGGEVVKQSMGPVYSNTQSLHTMNTNIDRMLAAISNMQKPLEEKDQEERIIRAGPLKTGLDSYIASLKRIERAIFQMNSTNLRVNQQSLGDLNELMNDGSNQLQQEFQSALNQHGVPVEPLHYITKQLPFPTIEQDKASWLRSIESFISSSTSRDTLRSSRDTPTFRMYIDLRGSYLAASLQNLATASVQTSKKKTPEEIYRQGTSGISTYAAGMEGILLAEYQNISSIFPQDAWPSVFQATCHKPLAELSKTLREINMQIKSHLITDSFLAYEIISTITALSSNLSSQTTSLKPLFAEALKPIRETAKSSLPNFVEDIRRRASSITSFPHDCSSIPLTTEILTRLQTLSFYPAPVTSLLTSLGPGNWLSLNHPNTSSSSLPSLASLDVGSDTSHLLPTYILDSIETYLTTLESRARTLIKGGKPPLGVFLANNVAVIDRLIRSSDLSTLLSAPSSPAGQKLDIWRKKGFSYYLDSWREPCSALLDVQYTNRPRPQSGSQNNIDSAAIIKGLSNKDKDAIKEKFRMFNTSFEDLSNKHRALAMEREVRSLLAREIQGMIEPLYARFWDRYHEIDKGKGKYVKWDKGGLSGALVGLG